MEEKTIYFEYHRRQFHPTSGHIMERLHFLIFNLHQPKEDATQGIRAFLFENSCYNKRPIAKAIGRFSKGFPAAFDRLTQNYDLA